MLVPSPELHPQHHRNKSNSRALLPFPQLLARPEIFDLARKTSNPKEYMTDKLVPARTASSSVAVWLLSGKKSQALKQLLKLPFLSQPWGSLCRGGEGGLSPHAQGVLI